jgi:nucleoside-diphosphate-sugar epimerase
VRDRTPDAAISIEPLRAPDAEPVEPLSITAADRELGYRPRWGLARGIDDFWTWREAEGAC